MALLVYVNDIIIVSDNQECVNDQLKKFLNNHFKLKDLGDLKHFLGLEVAMDPSVIGCKIRKTPMDSSLKLP